jgi:hypothetical protein
MTVKQIEKFHAKKLFIMVAIFNIKKFHNKFSVKLLFLNPFVRLLPFLSPFNCQLKIHFFNLAQVYNNTDWGRKLSSKVSVGKWNHANHYSKVNFIGEEHSHI